MRIAIIIHRRFVCLVYYSLTFKFKITFLSLSSGLISRFLSSTCTEVSGVENIGQCGRLSQFSWLLGAL